MKLGSFTQESILEYRQKANSQLCQKPDGSIYGIPQDRECVTGKPISDPGEENIPVEDQEKQSLLKAAIERVRQSGEQLQQLKDALARNIEERLGQREQQPASVDEITRQVQELYQENFQRIEEAYGEFNSIEEMLIAITAHEEVRNNSSDSEVIEEASRRIEALNQILNNSYNTLTQEFSLIREDLLVRGNRELATENANNTSFDLPEDHPFSEEDYRNQLIDLYQIANNRVNSLSEIFDEGEGRAYATSPSTSTSEDGEILEFSGTIATGRSASWENQNSVFWHEFGHHIEFSNPEIYSAMVEFRNSRATSDQPVSMNELTNSTLYNEFEVALPGNYIDPYVGKVYPELPEGGFSGTEVFSMGFQYFSDPQSMRRLYEQDPEYFKLIVGSLLNL